MTLYASGIAQMRVKVSCPCLGPLQLCMDGMQNCPVAFSQWCVFDRQEQRTALESPAPEQMTQDMLDAIFVPHPPDQQWSPE